MRVFSRIGLVVTLLALVLSSEAGAFSAPMNIASGLRGPHDLAMDERGALYVSERPSQRVAVLTRMKTERATDADQDEDDSDDATVGVNAAAGPSEVYRAVAAPPFTFAAITSIAFDAQANVYFVEQTGSTPSVPLRVVRSRIVRVDRRTRAATVLFSAESTSLFGFSAIKGIAVNRSGLVYFGLANTLLRVRAHQAATVAAAFPVTAQIVGWPVIEADGAVAVVVADGGSTSLYVIRRGEAPFRLASLRPTTPGASGFGAAGADARGDLYLLQRVPNGFVRFSCAASTTIRIMRISGHDVRTATAEVLPTEVGTVTRPGHTLLFGGSPTYYRVSRRGDVFLGLYPAVPSCPPAPFPPWPLSNRPTSQNLFGFEAQPDGTLVPHLLLQQATGAWGVTGAADAAGLTLATDPAGRLFVASWTEGTLLRSDPSH